MSLSIQGKKMDPIENKIKELEEKLLHSDVRENPEILKQLLSDEFEEIGSNGKISSREDVIDWLLNKEKNISWSLSDFRIKKITSDIVISIYRARKIISNDNVSNGSMRSSIWKFSDSQWKMIFHQGTKIE